MIESMGFEPFSTNWLVLAYLVYVRNRARKKDWLAIICTNMTLSEAEIIRIYGKRWDIEVFFKEIPRN